MTAATGAPRVPDAGSARTAVGAPLGFGRDGGRAGVAPRPLLPDLAVGERFWDGAAWTPRLRHGSVFPGRTVLGPGFFTLAAWLRGLFYVQVGVGAAGAVVAVWVVSVLDRWLRAPDSITVAEGNRVDCRRSRGGRPEQPSLRRHRCGLHHLAVEGLLQRPGRPLPAAPRPWLDDRGWFVPLLNLFRPFQVVRDLRDGIRSAMGATGPDRRRWLVRAWWAAFVTVFLLDSWSRVVDTASGSRTGLGPHRVDAHPGLAVLRLVPHLGRRGDAGRAPRPTAHRRAATGGVPRAGPVGRAPARTYHSGRGPDASRGEPARHHPGGCPTR